MTDLITRPAACVNPLRCVFEETTLSLNDPVLPIFVEEEIDDYKAIEAMPGVMRIPEKYLAREIERIANAGIRSVMTLVFLITPMPPQRYRNENGLVARMSRICKSTVPEMIVMSDTCFCEYTSHGHCGVLCDHGVDNDATRNLGKQAVVAPPRGRISSLLPPRWTDRYRRFAARWMLPVSLIRRSCPTDQVRFFLLRPVPRSGRYRAEGRSETYQMSPMNRREAIRESLLDEARGADCLMVKPAGPTDILRDIRERSDLAARRLSGQR